MAAATEVLPKRQRILIVEDEPFIRLALEAMLPELGFDVAGSAAQISAARRVRKNFRSSARILSRERLARPSLWRMAAERPAESSGPSPARR